MVNYERTIFIAENGGESVNKCSLDDAKKNYNFDKFDRFSIEVRLWIPSGRVLPSGYEHTPNDDIVRERSGARAHIAEKIYQYGQLYKSMDEFSDWNMRIKDGVQYSTTAESFSDAERSSEEIHDSWQDVQVIIYGEEV